MAEVFSDLLELEAGSVRPPPLKPAGTYQGIVSDFKYDKSREKKTPFVRFTVGNVSPGPNINPDDLFTDDGKGGKVAIELSKYKPSLDYYITPDALYRLTEMMKTCGIKTDGRSVKACISDMKLCPVIIEVIQETRTNQETGETNLVNKVSDMKGVANT